MSNENLETRTVTVDETLVGNRLDRLLALAWPDVSRARFQGFIGGGAVTVNGKIVEEAKFKPKSGDEITVEIAEAAEASARPQAMALDIYYEDDDVIVIDKPAGLVVHPGAGHLDGTLVNALVAHCGDSLSGIGGVKRPGIVHRLDKDTSGLLVVAKNDAAHLSLSKQFASHGRDGSLERAYKALVWGKPTRRTGKIETQIARHPRNRQKMAVVREGGRHAVTHFKIDKTYPPATEKPVCSLVECVLETGRTHQIRVHMAHIGHPVMGDQVYGAGFQASAAKLAPEAREMLEKLARQALHAFRLGFKHPKSGEKLVFEAPLPPDLAEFITKI